MPVCIEFVKQATAIDYKTGGGGEPELHCTLFFIILCLCYNTACATLKILFLLIRKKSLNLPLLSLILLKSLIANNFSLFP